jgi:glycosyltransferase involved in cell wall biosynthesis
MISVVIPTHNAESGLVRTLSSLLEAAMRGLVRDVVIADGGSSDLTLEIAEDAGCTIVRRGAARGGLLDAGARAAKGPWLLFLHADTALEPGWDGEAYNFVRQGDEAHAATFRFALDDKRWAARRAELVTRLRNKVLALPYGDQGLLIAKAQYERLGGFKDLPILDDVDFVTRLKRDVGRAGIARLSSRAVTSGARYFHRPLRNLSLLTLYGIGVSPERLARLYR